MDNSIVEKVKEYALTDPFYFNELSSEICNDVLLMREIALNDGVYPTIMYYVGDDVQNDLIFHLNLLNHSDFSPLDYVMGDSLDSLDDKYKITLDVSDFSNSYVGINVRRERVFWEVLNEKLAEVGYKYPFYNVDKEVRIAVEEIENSKGKITK